MADTRPHVSKILGRLNIIAVTLANGTWHSHRTVASERLSPISPLSEIPKYALTKWSRYFRLLCSHSNDRSGAISSQIVIPAVGGGFNRSMQQVGNRTLKRVPALGVFRSMELGRGRSPRGASIPGHQALGLRRPATRVECRINCLVCPPCRS